MTRDATETLEPFRKYLKVLAELHLDQKLRGKLDPSDVVQQTMLRAYSASAELRDTRPEVLITWLRRILARTLADAAGLELHGTLLSNGVALRPALIESLRDAGICMRPRPAIPHAGWLANFHRPVGPGNGKPSLSNSRERTQSQRLLTSSPTIFWEIGSQQCSRRCP